jgi:hypothetical protein
MGWEAGEHEADGIVAKLTEETPIGRRGIGGGR